MEKAKLKFYEYFNLGVRTMKMITWYTGYDCHCDDWNYTYRTFDELKLGENITVDFINSRIAAEREKNPERTRALHGGVEFTEGVMVEAFIKYPEITAEKYLKLINVCGKGFSPINSVEEENIPDFYSNVLFNCVRLAESDKEVKYEVLKIMKEEEE